MPKRPRKTRLPVSFCPCCLHKLDAASHMKQQGARPRPGDFSICIECGGVLVFDADLLLIKPTQEAMAKVLREDPAFENEVRLIRRAITLASIGQPPPAKH